MATTAWAQLDRAPAPDLPGDAGFFGPDSMFWRVGRENALLLAGPATLLLQLAHPAVAEGVSAHSDFEQAPLRRLYRTFHAIDRILFGSTRDALDAASEVQRVHAGVRGRFAEAVGRYGPGDAYAANRPDLLLWVHATLVQQSLRAYQCFVGPLDRDERAAYYTDSIRFAQLFGVPAAAIPPTLPEFEAYFAHSVASTLAVGPCGQRLRGVLLGGLPLTWPIAPLSRVLAGGLLPPRVRALFQIRWSPRRAHAFAQLCRASRATLARLPAPGRYGRAYRKALQRVAATAPLHGRREERTGV